MLMRKNLNSDFSEISEVSLKGLFRVTLCLGFKTSPPLHMKMADLQENEAVGGTHFHTNDFFWTQRQTGNSEMAY